MEATNDNEAMTPDKSISMSQRSVSRSADSKEEGLHVALAGFNSSSISSRRTCESPGSPGVTFQGTPPEDRRAPLVSPSPISLAFEAAHEGGGAVCESVRRGLRQSASAPQLAGKVHRNVVDLQERKIVVGVCAMDKKTQAKPMQAILERIREFGEFETVVFGDEVILNEPIEKWPVCDVLMSWFSKGFPLEKTEEYAKLRTPYEINDLSMQHILMDRRAVFARCREFSIPIPINIECNRDNGEPLEFIEEDDELTINGESIKKPFLEKPISGEDHDIHIYYPKNAGGGCKRLFRKIGNQSSSFDPDCHRVRRDGSYIYEEFLDTEGVDLKTYAVGPEYVHVEARKSPTLDGVVQRDQEGKEIRYPVLLTPQEKLIAAKVVLAFGQNVCGFDLLRTHQGTYVCDVNGWSFVKKSTKYYNDASRMLRAIMLRAVAPQYMSHLGLANPLLEASLQCGANPDSLSDILGDGLDETLKTAAREVGGHYVPMGSHEQELRCVIAVVRHGDRTPKQKLKFKTTSPRILALWNVGGKVRNPRKEVKLKNVDDLSVMLDTVKALLDDNPECEEVDGTPKSLLWQMRDVLELHEFSGINRKIQLKPIKWSANDDGDTIVTDAQVVVKWGGELTSAGIAQAMAAGQHFRETMYPGESEGLLRLHATFRHDLKIYSSDEGRVQMTAAAFSKALLNLEGGLPPLLVSLVGKDGINSLLDDATPAERNCQAVREKLYALVTSGEPVTEDFMQKVVPMMSPSMRRAMSEMGDCSMLEILHSMRASIGKLLEGLHECIGLEITLEAGETPNLAYERWDTLQRDFYKAKTEQFEVSKVPSIYDAIKFDMQHNYQTLAPFNTDNARDLFAKAQLLAHVVVSQEYGMEAVEKADIAAKIGVNLIRKIVLDMVIASGVHDDEFPEAQKKHLELYRLDHEHIDASAINSLTRHVRTRLYFTSESHIMSMFHILRARGGTYPPVIPEDTETLVGADRELNYLTQIVFKVFEDKCYEIDDPRRFLAQMFYSTGARHDILDSEAYSIRPGSETKSSIFGTDEQKFPTLAPMRTLNEGIPLENLLNFLEQYIPHSSIVKSRSNSTGRLSTTKDSIPQTAPSPSLS